MCVALGKIGCCERKATTKIPCPIRNDKSLFEMMTRKFFSFGMDTTSEHLLRIKFAFLKA